LRGKTLYYASAIGTARLMADLILDRVVDFNPGKPLLLTVQSCSHPSQTV
jgi:hypothetical protein